MAPPRMTAECPDSRSQAGSIRLAVWMPGQPRELKGGELTDDVQREMIASARFRR